MKKTELKQILKPLIKECIKEVIFEEGVLSGIVSEVVQGFAPVITEGNTTAATSREHLKAQQEAEEERIMLEKQQAHQQMLDTKRKMLDAIGQNSYNGIDLFEGTTPLARESSPGNSLGGVDPADSGIDITGLVGRSRIWSEMIK